MGSNGGACVARRAATKRVRDKATVHGICQCLAKKWGAPQSLLLGKFVSFVLEVVLFKHFWLWEINEP